MEIIQQILQLFSRQNWLLKEIASVQSSYSSHQVKVDLNKHERDHHFGYLDISGNARVKKEYLKKLSKMEAEFDKNAKKIDKLILQSHR